MVKVFTTNKDGKIELTKDELKALLDEAYWDGYRANSGVYIYKTPSWTPYVWSSTGTGITLSSNTASTSSEFVDANDIKCGVVSSVNEVQF